VVSVASGTVNAIGLPKILAVLKFRFLFGC
jgi:hypothetical protein